MWLQLDLWRSSPFSPCLAAQCDLPTATLSDFCISALPTFIKLLCHHQLPFFILLWLAAAIITAIFIQLQWPTNHCNSSIQTDEWCTEHQATSAVCWSKRLSSSSSVCNCVPSPTLPFSMPPQRSHVIANRLWHLLPASALPTQLLQCFCAAVGQNWQPPHLSLFPPTLCMK